MNFRFYKNLFILVIVVIASVMPSGSVKAQVGFQAKLTRQLSDVVANYDDPSRAFSVALYPKSIPYISNNFGSSSRLVASSFELDQFRFNRTYHRSLKKEYDLIPVSVGARDFNNYRTTKYSSTRIGELSTKQITTVEQKRGRGGLGLNVALPKRLDKIFGEGGAGLRVSGRRRITFSGRSQWTDALSNDVIQQNKFPSLNMEQVSRFEIVGTIGSKISVKVNQDSQTDIPLANRIQIRYKGDEDDILKTIEAGNTTLSLPNTRFVGYSSRINGLFGIKAAAQVGGLTLTAIASQEKGASEKSSFSASGEEKAAYIRDHAYVEARIFDLALPRDSLQETDTITTLIIYEVVTDQLSQASARKANMWVDPDNPGLFEGQNIEETAVIEIENENNQSFEFYQDSTKNYVVFRSARPTTKNLGYYMEYLRDGVTLKFGDIEPDLATDSSINLKLLYKHDAGPNDETWKMMWRNCYNIPSGVSADDLDLKIFKGLSGTENTINNKDIQEGTVGGSYIEVLGLDQYDNGSLTSKIPDGKVDNRFEIIRSNDWGLLVFPSREPFNSDTSFVDDNGQASPELDIKVSKIYDFTSLEDKVKASQYYIKLTNRSISSTIRLNKANIIEGSETVYLNNVPLTRGTDYSIQYDFGQITLLTDLVDANADVRVEFEYAPFFVIQKKTLFGLRAQYDWSKNFNFGTTLLYKSDKAEERKPRVGQETAKMTVLDFDASLKLQPKILTNMVDALPLIETEAASNINITGEVAQSRPNPNVNDVAYIDDFESAIENLTLGTTRTSWKKASAPFQLPAGIERGRMLWHTPRNLVRVEDVYDRESAQGEGSLRTLRMVFRPNTKDTSVVDTTIVDNDTTFSAVQIDDVARPTWAGLTRWFSGRISDSRLQLFEMRARTSANFSGKLHFEFGKINEDINGDGHHFDEDDSPKDFLLDSLIEDRGFDGLLDQHEPFYSQTSTDPNGDNWFFKGSGKCPFPDNRCNSFINNKEWEQNDSLYYEWLNGTEGNRKDASVVGRPDEERFSTTGFKEIDEYFSYEIDFSDPTSKFYRDSLIVEGSEKANAGSQPWHTYRIPILDPLYQTTHTSIAGGEPDWSQVTHVRIWWESDLGQITYDTLEVASWYMVQSNWQEQVIFSPLSDSLSEDASSVVVASIGEDENPAFASTPAETYKDPTTNVTEPRKGLLIKYQNLNTRDTVMAVKDLLSIDQYSGYGRLQMFVHSDIDPIEVGNMEMFFRLGRDSLNFYEQKITLRPEWDKQNFIDISFDEITGIKDDGLKELEEDEVLDITKGEYRVRGNPNINQIRYFAVGLVNADTAQSPALANGEIWLDELRVTDVRKNVGTAGRLSVTGNMADLLSFNFNYQSQDPYFRGISTATRGGGSNNLGSGKTQTSYSLGTTISVEKFLPRSWSARIPVSISISKATTTPLLRTNSDIVLSEEKRKEEQSINESQSISVSESFSKKGGNPLFSILLNRLTTSFSYRRNTQQSVNTPYTFGENYTVNSAYNLSIKKIPSIPIFFWTKPLPFAKKAADSKLSLYPASWRTSAIYSRNLNITDDVNEVRRTSLTRSFDGRMDLTYKMFPNLNITYNYNTKRDLSDLDLIRISFKDPKLGIETNYSQSFSATYNPALLSFFSTNLSYKATYRDDFNRSNRSKASRLGTSKGVTGTFDHIKLLGGKSSSGRSSRFSGNRGRVGTRGSGRTEDEEKKSGTPLYKRPLQLMRFLTGWIQSPSYQYSVSYNASIPGLLNRPNWRYRFGLDRTTNVPLTDDSRSIGSNEGSNFSANSSFTLLGGVTTDVKYRTIVTRDIITVSERNENTTTSWPDLAIRIQQFKTLPIFKGVVNKFIDIFAPRTGYTRQIKENFNIDRDFVTSRVTTQNFNPLLSINFRVMRSLSLSGSYSLTKENDKKFNAINGKISKETERENKSIAVSTKYSFSAPGGISIPLFGKLKFKSTMNFELGVKKTNNLTQTAQDGGTPRVSVDRSDISIIPIISYVFSQQIKGGLSGRWQDSNDKNGQKSHTREIRIWAEISF